MTWAADTNAMTPLVPGLCHACPLVRQPVPQPAVRRTVPPNLATGQGSGEAPVERPGERPGERDVALQNSVELDRFLEGVERRAFRIALLGLRNPDDALDVVQDAMMQLARKYSDRPPAEWTPLFYRILNNRIRDFQRHGTVRARVLALLPGGRGSSGEAGADISQHAEDLGSAGPQRQSMLDDSMAALEDAVGSLPPRQREAFLLRTLEGLNVRDTAAAMNCSEGSVKTHHFRAVGALREALGEHWSTED